MAFNSFDYVMPAINACCALTLCLIYTVYETAPVLRHELHNSLFCHLGDPGQTPQTVMDQKEKKGDVKIDFLAHRKIISKSRQKRGFVQGVKRLNLYFFLQIFGSERRVDDIMRE